MPLVTYGVNTPEEMAKWYEAVMQVTADELLELQQSPQLTAEDEEGLVTGWDLLEGWREDYTNLVEHGVVPYDAPHTVAIISWSILAFLLYIKKYSLELLYHYCVPFSQTIEAMMELPALPERFITRHV